MKRRELVFFMPFMALAQTQYAHSATKKIAKISCPPGADAAAPFIRASELIRALLLQSLLPAARAFTERSETLCDAIRTRPWAACRPRWVNSMLAWETLAAVPVAALVERRSVRAIDFWPTRPAQIQAVLDGGPARLRAPATLPTLGASARGLPALEWLLFRTDGDAASAALADILADQVLQEARILEAAYTTLSLTEWDEADAWTAYGEWFSQAVGSLDQLRLKKLKPNTRGKDSAIWVRGVSGQTRAAWQAHAHGLQAFFTGSLSVGPASASLRQQHCNPSAPVAGTLHSLLLGRRYPAEAVHLQALTTTLLQTVARATPDNLASQQQAQQATARLHRFVSDVGSELFDFSQGFTDADGD